MSEEYDPDTDERQVYEAFDDSGVRTSDCMEVTIHWSGACVGGRVEAAYHMYSTCSTAMECLEYVADGWPRSVAEWAAECGFEYLSPDEDLRADAGDILEADGRRYLVVDSSWKQENNRYPYLECAIRGGREPIDNWVAVLRVSDDNTPAARGLTLLDLDGNEYTKVGRI